MSLASFVPRLALSIAAEGPIPETGRVRDCQAAALFVDISGFTGWVDILTARFGEHGAERLQDVLNASFTPVVDAVDRAGGQVLAFPGDAVLALWPVPLESAAGSGLADAARKAAQCALDVRDRLMHQIASDDIELRFHAVVTAGAVKAAIAGGVDGQWHLVVGGPAITQLAAVSAAVGEVVMSAEAETLAGAWRDRSVAPLSALIQHPPDPAVPLLDADAELSPLVPISARVRMENAGDGWLSEFRVVTVMFVVFGDPAVAENPQHAVRTIQTITRRFDGDLNQLVADEKGLTAVVVFGLFQRTHEDDALRAIGAARALANELGSGQLPRIGIATGRVFSGIRGSATRRELAVIGPSVILAARLASVADPILCDAATYARSKTRFRFDDAGPLPLKGKGIVSGVWQPREPIADGVDAERDRRDASQVARRRELALAEGRLRALAETGRGGLMIVSGEAGIGKSTLTSAIRDMARTRRLRCASGAGESLHTATTLHAWRPIITALLSEHGGVPRDVAGLTNQLATLLGASEIDWFPLLDRVLPVHIPENERTAHLTAESRARITRQLLDALLRRLTSDRDLLLVIEDIHWIDSSSWDVIEIVVRIPHVVVLITTRPTPEVDARLATLGAGLEPVEIALSPMSSGEIAEIVARRVGADGVSPELSQWLSTRCEGNPLFGQELAVMLVEDGSAVIEDGTCRLAQRESADQLRPVPTTVQSVLAARIDRLSAGDQLIIKVAAVFGRHFRLDMLTAVSPVQEEVAALGSRIERIAATGLLVRIPDRTNAFAFSHALVQEVSYGLLPFARRRVLHRAAAEYIERVENTSDPSLFPLLAHHWERADDASAAMRYLELAGEHALLNASSNPEAEAFLTRLIALERKQVETPNRSASAPPPHRSARWERMLSQAIARQGRHAEALLHLERGLTLLGRSVPHGDWKGWLEAARGLAPRLLLPPPRPASSRRPDEAACLEAIRLYDNLGQLLYVVETGRPRTNHSLIAVVSALRSAALGEQVGLSGELSRGYSMMANLIALFGRPRLALQYADRARDVALAANDKQALFRALSIGQLPAFVFGRWGEAEERLNEGLVLGMSLRNLHETLIAECTLGHIDLHRDRLDEALRRFDGIATRAREAAFILPELWAMAGVAHVRLRQDRLTDAIAAAEACVNEADSRGSSDLNSRFEAYGVLASAWTRRGEWHRALAVVEPAMRAAGAGAHLSFSSLAGFVGVTEALLDACASPGGDRVSAEARLRKWLRRFSAVAFCRPIFQPARLHFHAEWHQQRGRRRRAQRQFTAAIRAAERLGMPYDARRSAHALAHVGHQPSQREAGARPRA